MPTPKGFSPVESSSTPAGFSPVAEDTSSSTPQQSWWDELTKPVTEIQSHHMPHNMQELGQEALKGVGNIGAAALGTVLHPINTLGGMANFALRANPAAGMIDTLRGKPDIGTEMGTQFAHAPLETVESAIGQAGAMPGFEAELGAPLNLAKTGAKVLRSGANILAGTTPRVAMKLGEATEAANAAAEAKAAEANTGLVSDRAKQLQQHFEKTQAVREQNEAAQGVQSRKAALERGVEQLDPKFQEDLKATEKDVRAQASAKYDDVRAATAGETIPSDSLAQAVRQAESNIQGSSENLKVFRDILSKHPEGEPASIKYQGAEIPKGHALYDVLKEGQETPPATFTDLQGYYSELGNQLSKGNLPGDVYLATKSLQESIGDLMQGMAEKSGVGPQLTDARSFYRDYMNAFRDYKSPLNKAMNATERGKAIQALRTADQTGIQTLARYNPELAQRANTIRGYQAEARSLPAKAPALKPEPTLPPAKPPVLADVKKVGLGDIQSAKEAALAKRADLLASKGMLYGTVGIGVYPILRSVFTGHLGTLGLEGASIVTPYALAKVFENPTIVKWLTKPTPADIAAIPPDVRANLPQIVSEAKARGIKVSPILSVMGTQSKQ